MAVGGSHIDAGLGGYIVEGDGQATGQQQTLGGVDERLAVASGVGAQAAGAGLRRHPRNLGVNVLVGAQVGYAWAQQGADDEGGHDKNGGAHPEGDGVAVHGRLGRH